MKRMTILLLAAMLLLVSCGEAEVTPAESSMESTVESSTESSGEPEDNDTDKTPPAFVDAKNGKLPAVSHDAGEEVDLLSDIVVMDNRTATEDLVLSISDNGGYDPTVPGVYTLTISACDSAANEAKATLQVTVKQVYEKITLTLGGDLPYVENDTSALVYTSSGTSFRTDDVIQVMDKDFFLTEYNAHKASLK